MFVMLTKEASKQMDLDASFVGMTKGFFFCRMILYCFYIPK